MDTTTVTARIEIYSLTDGVNEIGHVWSWAGSNEWHVHLDRADEQIATTFPSRQAADNAGFHYWVQLEMADLRAELYDALDMGVMP